MISTDNKSFLKLLFIALLTYLPLSAMGADEIFEYDNLNYRIVSDEEKTVEVAGYVKDKISKSLVIPGSLSYNNNIYTVKYIGQKAFNSCKDLESVQMANTIEIVKEGAFAYCKSLKKIKLSQSLTSIESTGLNNCISLSEVSLPDGLLYIGDFAFSNCESLNHIEIPETVETIKGDAFCHCKALKNIRLPANLEVIPCSIFNGCSSLTSIELPENLKRIEAMAFCKCPSLSSITIPESLEYIGFYAFWDCASLKKINIPKGLEISDQGVFMGCTSLRSFILDEENPYYYTDGKILYNKEKTKLISYPSAHGDIIIIDSIEWISQFAFAGCNGIYSVTLPASVTDVGRHAFSCRGLRNAILLSPMPPNGCDFGFEDYNSGGFPEFIGCTFYVPDEYISNYENEYPFRGHVRPLSKYTGVEEISISHENDRLTVYTLDGRLVCRGASRETIGTLDRGVYIVNGRKMLLP